MYQYIDTTIPSRQNNPIFFRSLVSCCYKKEMDNYTVCSKCCPTCQDVDVVHNSTGVTEHIRIVVNSYMDGSNVSRKAFLYHGPCRKTFASSPTEAVHHLD